MNLNHVIRVIPSVYITPLEDVKDRILGIINLQGQAIPIIDTRKVLSHIERDQDITDMIIIVHAVQDRCGLLVDSVKGIIELQEEEVDVEDDILHSLEKVERVSKLGNDLLFIIDPAKLLSSHGADISYVNNNGLQNYEQCNP